MNYVIAKTEDELNALKDGTIVQVVRVRERIRPVYEYFEKFGSTQWVKMDPSDRDDGEYTESSGYLIALATGFGKNENGFVRVLFEPGIDDE